MKGSDTIVDSFHTSNYEGFGPVPLITGTREEQRKQGTCNTLVKNSGIGISNANGD